MSTAKCNETDQDIENAGFGDTPEIVGRQYKMIALYWPAGHDTLRNNEFKRLAGAISHKTLRLAASGAGPT